MKKYVYSFGNGTADGDGKMKDTLGGKGAGLAEMSPGQAAGASRLHHLHRSLQYLLPEQEQRSGGDRRADARGARRLLEERMGQKLGDAANPLLVSVRSGAKFSMPGMMDTILNLGLNDETVKALEAKSSNPRFAYDCYRRFIQMYGNVVLEIPKDDFDEIFDGQKKKAKAKLDTELTAEDLKQVIAGYKKLVQKKTGKPFPQDAMEQLAGARDAVFRSWFNDRAKHYRKMNQIPDDLGTAVNVQAMVFGNMGETSATGVGFTRNPATGEKVFYGEFLENAQGEDVVAGIRTPHPIAELEDVERRGLQAAPRNHHHARKALPRHAGFRVHHPGRQALHAADPQRQAHGSGGGPHRGGDGGGRPDHEGRSRPARRSAAARSASAPGARSGFQEVARQAGHRPAGLARRGGRHHRLHGRRSGGGSPRRRP